jgi:thiamine biosynthesis lipoprotein
MHTDSFDALGTRWWIELFDDKTKEQADAAFGRVRFSVTTFEATYSRFKPNSLISQLNIERKLEHPPAELIAMLTFAKDAYQNTEGVFNILTGHIQEERGYGFGYGCAATQTPGNPVHDIYVSSETITISNAATIDFGGFGKGWLIDSLAKELKAAGWEYFLINGGGDMFVTSERGEPIEIHLEHPTKPGFSVGSTRLKDLAFAASSPHKRQWQTDGQTYSHLMPATTGAVASFIIASSTRDADMFATTTALLPEADCAILATRGNLGVARYTYATNTLWSINWPR